MKKQSFLGTWQLLSCEYKDNEGQAIYPYGQDAIGYLTYTEDDYMFASIMKANRPQFKTEDISKVSTEEKIMALQTYLSYCGQYEIQANEVCHHIKASMFPNWMGTTQKRFFEFEQEDRLLLKSSPFSMHGKQRVAYMVWAKSVTNASTGQ